MMKLNEKTELDEQIRKERHNIVTDGYDMSIGELMSLYRDEELIINPVFQRLFRWSISQKTRFIESLLLGIPIPPVFVYQNEDGIWELIDGLQRLSTVFEFAGILRDSEGELVSPSVLEGTKLLPSLANRAWNSHEEEEVESIGKTHELEIKRARMRVEILKKESDPLAKYELFQRLNTGGSHLSEQEVRNAVMVMVNREFYDWLSELAQKPIFLETVSPTRRAKQRQKHLELALRFFAYRNVEYQRGLDVHEYLDKAMLQMATRKFDMLSEKEIFIRTFNLLSETVGEGAFRKWDGDDFKGAFSISVYEVVAYGVSLNIDDIERLPTQEKTEFVKHRIIRIWNDEVFQRNSGGGVRGTTRLANLLPIAGKYFDV